MFVYAGSVEYSAERADAYSLEVDGRLYPEDPLPMPSALPSTSNAALPKSAPRIKVKAQCTTRLSVSSSVEVCYTRHVSSCTTLRFSTLQKPNPPVGMSAIKCALCLLKRASFCGRMRHHPIGTRERRTKFTISYRYFQFTPKSTEPADISRALLEYLALLTRLLPHRMLLRKELMNPPDTAWHGALCCQLGFIDLAQITSGQLPR